MLWREIETGPFVSAWLLNIDQCNASCHWGLFFVMFKMALDESYYGFFKKIFGSSLYMDVEVFSKQIIEH